MTDVDAVNAGDASGMLGVQAGGGMEATQSIGIQMEESEDKKPTRM